MLNSAVEIASENADAWVDSYGNFLGQADWLAFWEIRPVEWRKCTLKGTLSPQNR